MEITSKKRAELKSLASKEETILLIGKGGLTDTLVDQVDKALTKRELVKIGTLETAPVEVREGALEIAQKTNSVVVQTIGSKIVLYRPNLKKANMQKKKKLTGTKKLKAKLAKKKKSAATPKSSFINPNRKHGNFSRNNSTNRNRNQHQTTR